MQYCENWERIQKRFLEFWARENHDRPLLKIQVWKDCHADPLASKHATIRERWMDTEYMIQNANWQMQNTLYLGEAFPVLNPNLGPDYFAAGYGVELEFGESTSWAKHFLKDEDVEDYQGFRQETENLYYAKMEEMTKAAVEDGKDKYFVGVTDLHPGADCLVSLRGPQNLCLDVYDHPDFIRRGVMDLFPGFRKEYERLYGLTTKYQEGSSCWMELWHPGKWYVPSCDFSCMISPEQYEELIVEEITKETEFLDASIYHLDGPDALRHLDRILQIPKLNGVQWVYGAGQPGATHWLPEIRRIQAAGKCVVIEVSAEELGVMLEEVPPEGVFYHVTGVRNEEHARALMKMAERQDGKGKHSK